jgi:hypothetical protein
MHADDDYGDCLSLLSDPDIGLDGDLVWEHFGKREPWDLFATPFVKSNGESRCTEAIDPFAFVYEK